MDKAISTRIQKWDNIKFLLIFCVVLGHMTDVYADNSLLSNCIRLFLFTFHMPAFVFISGLFEKKNIKERRYNKIFSYLILFVFIKVITFFAEWIAYGERPDFSLLSTGNVAWYAFCLFAFNMITILTEKFSPKYVLIASVLIALFAGYDKEIGEWLCLSRVIVFYPFYYLGFILDPKKVMEVLNKKSLKVLSALIIASVIVIICLFNQYLFGFKFVFAGRIAFVKIMKDRPCAFVYRMICYVVSVLVGGSVICLVPDKLCKGFFAKLGAKSVQIYALHSALKHLWLGLVSEPLGIEKYFGRNTIVIYELAVTVALIIICVLPIWKPLFDKMLNVKLRDSE